MNADNWSLEQNIRYREETERHQRLVRLRNALESIPVNNKPTLTYSDVDQITKAIQEASEKPWNTLADNNLRYELCVHFGWNDLQENYGG